MNPEKEIKRREGGGDCETEDEKAGRAVFGCNSEMQVSGLKNRIRS